MIPVLGIPVLNRGDLLLRCVRSIDYPVGKILIVNNGDDQGVADAIEQLQLDGGFDIEVYKPDVNLGVAASWNWMLREAPDAPYWLFVGNDIQFTEGDLRKMDEFVRAHPDWALIMADQGYSFMAVTSAGLQEVGYFDENFYPAYWEDIDHLRRTLLSGLGWGDAPDIHVIHGEAPHWGSSTINSDSEFAQRHWRTFRMNFDYFQRKWNSGKGDDLAAAASAERGWPTPYGDPRLSLRDWPLDHALAAGNGNPLLQRQPVTSPRLQPWRRWRSYALQYGRHRSEALRDLAAVSKRRAGALLRRLGLRAPAG